MGMFGGMFGGIGKALTAPIRATNSMMGMGNKVVPSFGGGQQQPQQQGQGIGPSPQMTPPPQMPVGAGAERMPELSGGMGGAQIGGMIGGGMNRPSAGIQMSQQNRDQFQNQKQNRGIQRPFGMGPLGPSQGMMQQMMQRKQMMQPQQPIMRAGGPPGMPQ